MAKNKSNGKGSKGNSKGNTPAAAKAASTPVPEPTSQEQNSMETETITAADVATVDASELTGQPATLTQEGVAEGHSRWSLKKISVNGKRALYQIPGVKGVVMVAVSAFADGKAPETLDMPFAVKAGHVGKPVDPAVAAKRAERKAKIDDNRKARIERAEANAKKQADRLAWLKMTPAERRAAKKAAKEAEAGQAEQGTPTATGSDAANTADVPPVGTL